jgi:hypothetical protein
MLKSKLEYLKNEKLAVELFKKIGQKKEVIEKEHDFNFSITSPISEKDLEFSNQNEFADWGASVFYFFDLKPGIEVDGGGIVDDRSRKFCKHLAKDFKYYSRAEINMLSFRLGQSVFNLTGKIFNRCRHTWTKIEFEPPANRQGKLPKAKSKIV